MQTFQIYKCARRTAQKHIQSQIPEVEQNGHKYIQRGENHAIQKIARHEKNSVFDGVRRGVRAAEYASDYIQHVVSNAAYYARKRARNKDKYLHIYEII